MATRKYQNFGKISDNFVNWSRISPDWKKIIVNPENDVANCGHSLTLVNLVNLHGPQTAQDMTVALTRPKSTFWDAYLEDKGRCTKNFAVGRRQLTLANVYSVIDGSTETFLQLKFENWPKIQCTVAYIVRVCSGNCTNFYTAYLWEIVKK